SENGSLVLLKDVARVEMGEFSYTTASRVNGKASSGMMISQTPGGNAVETAEGIYETLDNLKKSFPNDVDYVIGYETISVVNAYRGYYFSYPCRIFLSTDLESHTDPRISNPCIYSGDFYFLPPFWFFYQ